MALYCKFSVINFLVYSYISFDIFGNVIFMTILVSARASRCKYLLIDK